MAYQDDLITTRANVAAQLARITANPKPTYTLPDGKTVGWGEHYRNLSATMKELEESIGRANGAMEIQ